MRSTYVSVTGVFSKSKPAKVYVASVRDKCESFCSSRACECEAGGLQGSNKINIVYSEESSKTFVLSFPHSISCPATRDLGDWLEQNKRRKCWVEDETDEAALVKIRWLNEPQDEQDGNLEPQTAPQPGCLALPFGRWGKIPSFALPNFFDDSHPTNCLRVEGLSLDLLQGAREGDATCPAGQGEQQGELHIEDVYR